jgi:hypothetical protein
MPGTNGKAERLIKTLLPEWAHAMPIKKSEVSNRWLPRCMAIYSGCGCNMALADRNPNQQLNLLQPLNALAKHTLDSSRSLHCIPALNRSTMKKRRWAEINIPQRYWLMNPGHFNYAAEKRT